jgi:uncharacterized membrane protein
MKLIKTILLFMILSSCGNYLIQKKSDENISFTTQEKLSGSFESVAAVIFSAKCVTCHQQYSSYAGVVRELSNIQAAVTANRMPKNGPLNESQKNILLAWIDKGAPEFINQPSRPIEQNPLVPRWNSIYENIVSTKCLVCHNPNGQAKFLDLSSRESVLQNANRVFGNGQKLLNLEVPDESYLLSILQDDEEPMPPKSSNISRLSENDVNVLKEWISKGLPE